MPVYTLLSKYKYLRELSETPNAVERYFVQLLLPCTFLNTKTYLEKKKKSKEIKPEFWNLLSN